MMLVSYYCSIRCIRPVCSTCNCIVPPSRQTSSEVRAPGIRAQKNCFGCFLLSWRKAPESVKQAENPMTADELRECRAQTMRDRKKNSLQHGMTCMMCHMAHQNTSRIAAAAAAAAEMKHANLVLVLYY